MLRGAGSIALALPFLSAMVPAMTALGQTAARGNARMGFVYFPHGAVANLWIPKGTGRDFEMSPILKPLEKHRAQMTVISNLANKNAESTAVHAITSGTWLSCVHPRESHSPFGGVTIDQMAAKVLSKDTTFPSVEATTENGSTGGNGCDRNFGCSYGSTISFRTESQPLPMENNPRKLFYRLFGVGDTAEERSVAADEYGSLLDLVSEQARSLRASLGARDRAKLGDYLDSVREIELQVKKKEAQDLSALKLPDVPVGVNPDFDKQINLMFDLLALAFQGDLTRVVNMMVANEGSAQTYPWVGINEAFHPLSHHQENPEKMTRLARIQTYHSTVFARFLDKLAAMPDGERSVLDNSIFLYGSNMGNSNQHDHTQLPTSVFGGGRGTLKGNQHISMPENTPLSNVLLTLLERADVHVDRVGDSTGTIAQI